MYTKNEKINKNKNDNQIVRNHIYIYTWPAVCTIINLYCEANYFERIIRRPKKLLKRRRKKKAVEHNKIIKLKVICF